MTQFAMTTRTGSVVMKTNADNLEEAIDYFAKINNAQILLARDNWNAVYQAIQSNNRLPKLGDESDIDESATASSPTIELGSTKIS